MEQPSERRRAGRYPLSRWYLRPAAGYLAGALAPTAVRPAHLTVCGLMAAAAAAAVLLWRPEAATLAAVLVLAYWLCDRADGLLARRQRTVSAWGGWLDGNVDELVDVGLHVVTASVVALQVGASWPWLLLVAFLAGKYLFMYGLTLEEHARNRTEKGQSAFARPEKGTLPPDTEKGTVGIGRRLLRRAYHLPGNADVRVHLLVLALVTGLLAEELALVAVYYNLRWIVRYVLVARRLRGAG